MSHESRRKPIPTAGPWRTEWAGKRLAIRASHGRVIAHVVKHPGDVPEVPMDDFKGQMASPQDHANARLIADAPAMHALLKELQALIWEPGVQLDPRMADVFYAMDEILARIEPDNE